MRRPLACALALAVLLLAGCASAPSAPSQSSTATGGMGSHVAHAVSGHGAVATLRNALSAPVHKVLWANGTVAAQDTCNTGACVLDVSRAFHTTDITADLPAGAPVQVTVDLAYQPAPTQGMASDRFEAWIQSDAATFYTYTYDSDASSVAVQAVLLPAGTVEVVMAAVGPGGGTPDTPYTLRIAIDADPVALPPGVPVAVKLGPGATLAAASQAGPAGFLLYTPSDALLGSFKGNHTLPANAPTGEYALLLAADSPWANVTTDHGDARMAPLALRFEGGPVGDVPPQGAYDASWTVAASPLAVGLFAHGTPTGVGPEPLLSAGFSMSMTGPNGFALASPSVCHVCITFGFGYGIGSDLGDARVTAGEYRLHVQSDTTSHGLQVEPFAVFLER